MKKHCYFLLSDSFWGPALPTHCAVIAVGKLQPCTAHFSTCRHGLEHPGVVHSFFSGIALGLAMSGHILPPGQMPSPHPFPRAGWGEGVAAKSAGTELSPVTPAVCSAMTTPELICRKRETGKHIRSSVPGLPSPHQPLQKKPT